MGTIYLYYEDHFVNFLKGSIYILVILRRVEKVEECSHTKKIF